MSRVAEYRRQCTGRTETGLWALDLMQDDLGYVAISAAVGGVIRDTIPIVLAKYGICVSTSKRAEDEAIVEGVHPNERMLYIGADFYMRECECPKFRGQGKSLARLKEVMREWSAFSPGQLVPLLLLQRLIGMRLFHGRFQWRVRRYLNSGIRCIGERSGDHRVISRAWQRGVKVIFQRAMAREPFPMVQPSVWWDPGSYGCNSDASRPQGVADNSRGLGGNVMQFYFFGEWSKEETTLLDISTLELIAVKYLVVVAAITGQLISRMGIRCDNEAACRMFNGHCAASVAMSEALMVLEAIQCEFGVKLLAHHIAGEGNVIADELSRGKVDVAVQRLRELTGEKPAHVTIPEKWRDTSRLLRTVRG